MIYFPQPYPGEILYSVIARYQNHSLVGSKRNIYLQLFSKESVTAILTFPKHLEALKNNIGRLFPYSTQAIIDKFTVLPYYKNFVPPERYEQIITSMKYDGNVKINRFLTYFQKLQDIKNIPDYCPQCFQEDLHNYGEGYWHLDHQLPGMIICLKHNCFLLKPKLNLSLIDGRSYIPADPSICQESLLKLNTSDCLHQIAQKLSHYLKSPNSFDNDFYERACDKGFVRNNKLQIRKLIPEFEKHFSTNLLNQILKENASIRSSNWLKDSILSKLKLPFPCGSALIEIFFENYTPPKVPPKHPFGEGPWVCINNAANHFNQKVITNFTYRKHHHTKEKKIVGTFSCSCGMVYSKSYKGDREFIKRKAYGPIWEQKLIELFNNKVNQRSIAMHLGVLAPAVVSQANKLGIVHSWQVKFPKRKTSISDQSAYVVKRNIRLEQLKERWSFLLKNNGTLTISSIVETFSFVAGYAYLKLYSKEWLDQVNNEFNKNKKPTHEVRWKKRDKLILFELEQQHQLLLKSPPKRRICKTLIVSMARVKYSFLSLETLRKMPNSNHFISENCESNFNYYKRRVKMAVKELNEANETVTPTAVGKKTSLSYPLHPEIREIIEIP